MTEPTTDGGAVRHGEPPYFAYLEHPDGRWYATWMTHTQPRTERGHPWHVHADYSSETRMSFQRGGDWPLALYGMRNWDFDTLEEAVAFLVRERLAPRLAAGYQVVEGRLPTEFSLPAGAR